MLVAEDASPVWIYRPPVWQTALLTRDGGAMAPLAISMDPAAGDHGHWFGLPEKAEINRR